MDGIPFDYVHNDKQNKYVDEPTYSIINDLSNVEDFNTDYNEENWIYDIDSNLYYDISITDIFNNTTNTTNTTLSIDKMKLLLLEKNYIKKVNSLSDTIIQILYDNLIINKTILLA